MHARETRKPRLFRPRPAPAQPLIWLYLVATLVLALVFALQNAINVGMPRTDWPFWDLARWSLIQWYTWAALAPLVFRLGERHPLPFPLPFRALLRHIGYSIGVTLLAMVIGTLTLPG